MNNDHVTIYSLDGKQLMSLHPMAARPLLQTGQFCLLNRHLVNQGANKNGQKGIQVPTKCTEVKDEPCDERQNTACASADAKHQSNGTSNEEKPNRLATPPEGVIPRLRGRPKAKQNS
jgi:hypothetical protein